MHHHPVINAGVLLAGELTVITEENKRLQLKAGDSIVELVNKKNYGKNDCRQTNNDSIEYHYRSSANFVGIVVGFLIVLNTGVSSKGT